MKKFVIQAVLLVLVIGGALYIYNERTLPPIPFVPQPSKSAQITVGSTKVNVIVADTQEKRNKGLSGRENMASDSGMLFIFDKPDIHPFWMKEMKFPLDFIWIRDHKIVDITENVPNPPPGTKDVDLKIYQSKEPVDQALEVNGGFVGVHGIKIGDKIETIQ